MLRHRVWIEIVLLGTVIAFALAILLASLGAVAGAAVGSREAAQGVSTPAESFEGMVTCSRCGAKHQPNLDRSASTCVRVCVHGGANFALIHDQGTYLLIGDVASLKKVAGQRARVVGFRNGNTIEVSSVSTQI
jgi:hypothetical protein